MAWYHDVKVGDLLVPVTPRRTSRSHRWPVKKPHISFEKGCWRVRYINGDDSTWIRGQKFLRFSNACTFAESLVPQWMKRKT